jgi:hypothetical protein
LQPKQSPPNASDCLPSNATKQVAQFFFRDGEGTGGDNDDDNDDDDDDDIKATSNERGLAAVNL